MKKSKLIQLIKEEIISQIVLQEGTMDWLTTKISRQIINYIKLHLNKLEIPTLKLKVGDVDVNILFQSNSNIDLPKVKAANFNRINKNLLVLNVFIEFPESSGISLVMLNEFIPELKEILRHELEHYKQDIRSKGDKENPQMHYYSPNAYPPNQEPSNSPIENLKQYYLSADEIEAHVMGAYKAAKTRKIPLGKALANRLQWIYNGPLKHLDPKDSLQIVKEIQKAWIEYAQQRLPQIGM